MSDLRQDSVLDVVHVGQFGDRPGGMAQVVNQYLAWSFDAARLSAILSTRFARDPLGPMLAMRAAFLLLRFRLRHPRGVAVVHLSERGSFFREGGLLVLASFLGLGTVAHLHGAQFDDFATSYPRLVRFVLKRAGVVGVLSHKSFETVRAVVGEGADVRVVPNGVALPTELDSIEKENLVVFGGEFGFRKGADVLLAAWRDAAPRDGSWTLNVVGPVVDFEADLESSPHTIVSGRRTHAELLSVLARARIAVLPSRDEALPMFLLEAMAHACVVIATDVGQVSSLLEADNGTLVPAGDSGALAAALVAHMQADEVDLEHMGRRSRRLVAERYSALVVREKLIEFWRAAKVE